MFQKTHRFGSLRRLLNTLALFAILSFAAHTLNAQTIDCLAVQSIDRDMIWRGVAEAPGAAEHLAIDLPSAGIFEVEVAISNAHGGSPRLDVVPDMCGEGPAHFAVVSRSASHQRLVVSKSGRLLLDLKTVEPRHALGAYRVFSRFLPLEAVVSELGGGRGADASWTSAHTRLTDVHGRLIAERLTLGLPSAMTKTEMEEIDPNPAGLRHQGVATLDAAWLSPTILRADAGRVKTEMEEIDPNPAGLRIGSQDSIEAWVTASGPLARPGLDKTEMEEIDPNPAGLRAGGELSRQSASMTVSLAASDSSNTDLGTDVTFVRQLVAAVEQELALRGTRRPAVARQLGACSTRPSDDHHDALICATLVELGDAQVGSLSTDWQQDADAFGFMVHELTTVEVRAEGDVELSGVLFDGSGRRLDAQRTGDEVRIVEHLEPGLYIVRVESIRSIPGTYELAIRDLGD